MAMLPSDQLPGLVRPAAGLHLLRISGLALALASLTVNSRQQPLPTLMKVALSKISH